MIAGGGTGGHVLAGVAVADTWKAKFGDGCRIIFVGAEGGIEEKLVPRAGYPLRLLKLGSLNRVSLKRKIKTMFQLPLSLAKSWLMLWRENPQAVLGVGGYASGPLVLMARAMAAIRGGTRTAILEQNSVPGFTNRMLGRWVHKVFCAFPGMEKQFPSKQRSQSLITTGNPIRLTMKPMPSAKRDPFTIFIFGGSQGAAGINSLVLDSLPFLEDLKPKLRFIHQTGEKDYDRVLNGHKKAGTQARVEKFIHDMPACYADASLLVCRAGSSTLSEVAAVGRASVLVPFPFASDNHQEKNAQIYADAGAAYLMVQSRAKGQDLAELVRDLIRNPAKIERVEAAVRGFYRPDAAQDIVQALL